MRRSQAIKIASELISSVFYSGRLKFRGKPFGGLTATTLGGCGLWALNYFAILSTSSVLYFVILAGIVTLGIVTVSQVTTQASPDPRSVSLDELAGVWIALAFLPPDWWWMVPAILLFGALDIVKPLGIQRFEKLPSGWGVMLDDLAAGIVASLFLNGIRFGIKLFV